MIVKPFTDAGHSGPNLGTYDALVDGSSIRRPDPDGLIEKVVTLDIEDRLHASRGVLPFEIGRSRRFDHEGDMGQAERGRASMRYGASFVASLHVNDNVNSRCWGAQLYYGPGNKRTERLCREFAPILKTVFRRCTILDVDRARGRWIESPRSIIMAHAADVILFELGFRRCEHDHRLLMSELGRELIASALRLCIVRWAREYGS